MDNPFSWDYLTTVPGPNEVFGPFAIVFLVLFCTGFGLSVVVYNGWAKRWARDPVLHRMARKWSGAGLIVFGLGIFFFAIRWLQINPLNLGMRIWLWLSVIAVVALLGYILYDYRAHYDEAKRVFEEEALRRKYAKIGATGVGVLNKQSAYAGLRPPRPRPVKRRRRA
jgi:hypothetical protein